MRRHRPYCSAARQSGTAGESAPALQVPPVGFGVNRTVTTSDDGNVSVGDAVTAGQPVARITSERGDVLEEFVAQEAGTILAQRNKAFIRKGDWGILVAKND